MLSWDGKHVKYRPVVVALALPPVGCHAPGAPPPDSLGDRTR